MSRETEKIFEQMKNYLSQFELGNKEDEEKRVQEFMELVNSGELQLEDTPEMQSNDLLDQAYDAPTTKAKKLAKQALEVWPDNIDAECFLADFEKNPIKRLKLFNVIIEKTTKLLEKDNMFDDDCIGNFWGIFETRPYMRARRSKADILYYLGRYTEVMKECEDLIRLCENDNLGVRYDLMGVYCMLEKFDEAENLYKKYKEETAHMLFPMAFLYYKKGDYAKSKKFLKKLNTCNQYVYGIFNKDYDLAEDVAFYSIGSIEEASVVVADFLCFVESTPSFIEYMNTVLG